MLTNTQKVVFATNNQGKLAEMKDLLAPYGFEVIGLAQFSGLPVIVEDGLTFADNALIKAKLIAEHLQLPVLADDSGLCVDLLEGKPGIYSARYAGDGASDEANNAKLISELTAIHSTAVRRDDANVIDGEVLNLAADEDGGVDYLSAAQFKCALVLYNPQHKSTILAEGICEGYITAHPRGTQGFGYDPLFVIPELKQTMAELTPDVKNQISHRALAMQQLLAKLKLTQD